MRGCVNPQRNTSSTTTLGGPRRSLTGTAAALRDLIMLRFVVAVENAEVPGFGLGG
jgi:hypothetical protein